MATVRLQVLLSMYTDFENFSLQTRSKKGTVSQRYAGSAYRMGRRPEDAPATQGLGGSNEDATPFCI